MSQRTKLPIFLPLPLEQRDAFMGCVDGVPEVTMERAWRRGDER